MNNSHHWEIFCSSYCRNCCSCCCCSEGYPAIIEQASEDGCFEG